jgi:hypothetical protein
VFFLYNKTIKQFVKYECFNNISSWCSSN